MMKLYLLHFLSLACLFLFFCSCQTPQNQPDDLSIDDSRLMAWCIVPYDSQERSPAARMQMLEALGFSQYAYDWRTRHLSSFAEEIQLARQADIDIAAVWMWIDGQDQQPGALSADNERLLNIMREEKLEADLWLGFPDPYFEGLDEEASINKAAAMIRYLLNDTEGVISRVGLYNHGGWFGNPINQLKILDALSDERVGIVYNFHHAHEQIEDFPRLLKQMQPYLLAVNLNGMRKEGPKILPIGQGNAEAEMIHSLLTLCRVNPEDSCPTHRTGAIRDNLRGTVPVGNHRPPTGLPNLVLVWLFVKTNVQIIS